MDEMDQRRLGFMTAVGLLLENADDQVAEGIVSTLASFGAGLHQEVEKEGYVAKAFAAGVHPCPSGYHWDPETGTCVPD